MRESTALVMMRALLNAGCVVKVYDPEAMKECRRIMGDKVVYCDNMYAAADGADALLLLTEWKEFRLPDWERLGRSMARKLVLDGRNIYDKDELNEHGFEYHCIGK
jgi:UDPglucose 6-dehydrogenase